MGNLYQPQPLGDAEDSRRILAYGDRNAIGVEDPAASLTDFTGWNEAAAWTRRFEDAFEDEHDGYGLHKTFKVAKGIFFIAADWSTTPPTYHVLKASRCQDSTGNEYFGENAVLALTRVGQGILDVQFPAALAANMRIQQFTTGVWAPGNSNVNAYSRVYYQQTTAADTIRVIRYENDAVEDGHFMFAVHGW